MKYLFTLLLVTATLGLFAQEWRINADIGLASFPQKNRTAGLQLGLQLERSLPLGNRLNFNIFGGITQTSYTNNEQFFSERIVDNFTSELPLCDCFFINDRFTLTRTSVSLGTSFAFKHGRFGLAPGISLAYDLMGEVKQKKYYPSVEETSLLNSIDNNLWELRARRGDRYFESTEISRRFHPIASLAISYQLNQRFHLRLQVQETIGRMDLTETDYVRRSTIAMQIEPSRPRFLADASIRSLVLGCSYRL